MLSLERSVKNLGAKNFGLCLSVFVFGLVLNVPVSWAASGGKCNRVFAKPTDMLPKIADWRSKTTNANLDGKYNPTTQVREKEIKEYAVALRRECLVDGHAAEMEIFFEEGVDYSILKNRGDYGTHINPRYEVTGLGKSGILRGTILAQVSGHTSSADALRWAKSDTFSIDLKKDGKRVASLATNAKSKDVVTVQEISFQMEPKKVYRLLYERKGSAGAEAYPEGRVIELVWDGK